MAQYIDAHPQKVLLAHAHGALDRAGLGAIRTEPEKYMVLAALNLVECVAETLRPRREIAGEGAP